MPPSPAEAGEGDGAGAAPALIKTKPGRDLSCCYGRVLAIVSRYFILGRYMIQLRHVKGQIVVKWALHSILQAQISLSI